MIPWSLYWFYDDERVLARHAAGIGRLVDYLGTRAREHIVEFGLGDHMEPQADGTTSSSPRHTPPALTSAAYYYFDARVAARAAQVAGRDDDARRFGELADEIEAAINRRFLDPDRNNTRPEARPPTLCRWPWPWGWCRRNGWRRCWPT